MRIGLCPPGVLKIDDMNQPTDFSPELLDRYLAGEASRDERARAELWLKGRADRQAMVDVLRSVTVAGVASRLAAKPVYDIAGDWAKLKADIAKAGSQTPRRGGSAVSPLVWSRYIPIGIAATLIVMTAPRLFTYWSEREKSGRELFMPPREYATNRGQRAEIQLADGSSAKLGPETRLRVLGDGRSVELVGEALFKVTQSSREPFTVLAAGVTTTVLGTTFGVRAYRDDKAISVAVTDGKVQVQQRSKSLSARPSKLMPSTVLSAGDVALIEASQARVLRAQNLSQYVDWAEDRLIFSNTPLPEVVQELSRWYDVNIQLDSPELARSHFTASFKDEPLQFVLSSMSVTLGARYEWTGNRVKLLKK